MSLLNSPGLFSVFCHFSIMMSFVWYPPVRQLPSSPGPLIILFVTLPKAPIPIGTIVTGIFSSYFFQFSSKVEVLILLFTSFQFYSVVSRDSKVDNFVNSLFFCWLFVKSGRLSEIWRSMCLSKSYGSLCVSFSRTDPGLCIYHLFLWSIKISLHITQWITLILLLLLLLLLLFTH